MADILNRNPYIDEIEWLMKRGVPGRTLDSVVGGFRRAYEETNPTLAEDYINLLFDNLALHPLIVQPDARVLPARYIAENIEEALAPLSKIMKSVKGPVEPRSEICEQIREAYSLFHARAYDAQISLAAHARVFRIVYKIGVPNLLR